MSITYLNDANTSKKGKGKAPKRDLRQSAFNLLINSNKCVYKVPDKVKLFKEITHQIFPAGDGYKNLLCSYLKDRNKQNAPPDPNDIETIKITLNFEIGPERGFAHYHIGVEVKHYTNIQINGKDIDKMYRIGGLAGVFTSVSFHKGGLDDILRYNQKHNDDDLNIDDLYANGPPASSSSSKSK